MRYFMLITILVATGCGPADTVSPSFSEQERDAIRASLVASGSRITADVPEGLYSSLGNTHVEVHDRNGSIQGSFASKKDLNEFAKVSIEVTKSFLGTEDASSFRDWLKSSMADRGASVLSENFGEFKITLSRIPLRLNWTKLRIEK